MRRWPFPPRRRCCGWRWSRWHPLYAYVCEREQWLRGQANRFEPPSSLGGRPTGSTDSITSPVLSQPRGLMHVNRSAQPPQIHGAGRTATPEMLCHGGEVLPSRLLPLPTQQHRVPAEGFRFNGVRCFVHGPNCDAVGRAAQRSRWDEGQPIAAAVIEDFATLALGTLTGAWRSAAQRTWWCSLAGAATRLREGGHPA
jgi:hypothetical protein